MAENEITLAQLTTLLRSWDASRHTRNLMLVALPLNAAHRQAEELAANLSATYVDFDCSLLQQLTEDGWEEHLLLERKQNFTIGRMLAGSWLKGVESQLQRQKPLVIGNLNLAVRYEIDVAAALYDATENGLCIIAAGGRLQGQTLLIHGIHAQTGASAPAYQVVEPHETAAYSAPSPNQERLL